MRFLLTGPLSAWRASRLTLAAHARYTVYDSHSVPYDPALQQMTFPIQWETK